MIIITKPNVIPGSADFSELMEYLGALQGIRTRVHEEHGAQQTVTEIYLIGDTMSLDIEDIRSLPGVDRVVRVSQEYRIIGRHADSL